MGYLLDTSVILELLMDGPEADGVEKLLRSSRRGSLYLSEVAIHNLGNILLHEGLYDTYVRTLDDLLLWGGVRIARLGAEDLDAVVRVAKKHRLSYDDAYVLTTAEKHGLRLLSLDAHFDKTRRGRRTPAQALRR